MAFVHSKNSTLSVDDSGGTPRDISAYVSNVSLNTTADTAETTTFGVNSKGYVPGLKDATITCDIVWDATVDGYLFGILGAEGTVAYSPDNGTTTYSGEAICTSYTPASSVSDAVKGSASFQFNGDVSRA